MSSRRLVLLASIALVLAVVLMAFAVSFLPSNKTHLSSNKDDVAQVTEIGPLAPGERGCLVGKENATTLPISVAYSFGPGPGVTCLDVLVFNIVATPIEPGNGNLTVYDHSGGIVFTELLPFIGENTTFLLPGERWDSSVYWNSGETASPGTYQIVATVQYTIGNRGFVDSTMEQLIISESD
jgi:hypothetical protein